jgi:hypothetical protein
MFKPTRPLLKARRRLALTTKQAANKGGYYKGNRTGSQGWHTIWGGYIIDLRKVRTYVPPGNFATDTKAWEHVRIYVFIVNVFWVHSANTVVDAVDAICGKVYQKTGETWRARRIEIG